MYCKNSVTYYTKATAEIYFPENDVRCDLCPLLETYARRQCRRTGEYLRSNAIIGNFCPLKFEVKEK